MKKSTMPLALNLIEGGKTPLITVKEAEAVGFKIVFFGLLFYCHELPTQFHILLRFCL